MTHLIRLAVHHRNVNQTGAAQLSFFLYAKEAPTLHPQGFGGIYQPHDEVSHRYPRCSLSYSGYELDDFLWSISTGAGSSNHPSDHREPG